MPSTGLGRQTQHLWKAYLIVLCRICLDSLQSAHGRQSGHMARIGGEAPRHVGTRIGRKCRRALLLMLHSPVASRRDEVVHRGRVVVPRRLLGVVAHVVHLERRLSPVSLTLLSRSSCGRGAEAKTGATVQDQKHFRAYSLSCRSVSPGCRRWSSSVDGLCGFCRGCLARGCYLPVDIGRKQAVSEVYSELLGKASTAGGSGEDCRKMIQHARRRRPARRGQGGGEGGGVGKSTRSVCVVHWSAVRDRWLRMSGWMETGGVHHQLGNRRVCHGRVVSALRAQFRRAGY